MRSASELRTDLAGLGVRAGDTLMVHASLRKIGAAAGAVLDALEAAVSREGTLLMILGAVIEHEWVNQRPEQERAALLAPEAAYDPLTAVALPEVGYLAEAFRTRGGTLVTDNPSGRFAARGKGARLLLDAAPWDDYYGPGSPLERLCRAGGRVLRLGASPDTTTVLHYAEYVATVPGKRRVRRHYRVRGRHGPETRSVECLDDEHGIAAWPPDHRRVAEPDDDYFAAILRAYLALGYGQRGRVGGAAAELLEAGHLVDFGARWMSENLIGAGPALSPSERS